jgi:hypothetical protein
MITDPVPIVNHVDYRAFITGERLDSSRIDDLKRWHNRTETIYPSAVVIICNLFNITDIRSRRRSSAENVLMLVHYRNTLEGPGVVFYPFDFELRRCSIVLVIGKSSDYVLSPGEMNPSASYKKSVG